MLVFELNQLADLCSLHEGTVCLKGADLLSVVVPMFNEEAVLPLFHDRLRTVLDKLNEDYEVLVVDDGSFDDTRSLLEQMRGTWPQLRVLTLRRNAGHQAALTAGLDHCLGDAVITIDADLQDPPELIPALLQAALTESADIVYAVRSDRRSDTWFKRRTASAYYKLMRRAAGGGRTGGCR